MVKDFWIDFDLQFGDFDVEFVLFDLSAFEFYEGDVLVKLCVLVSVEGEDVRWFEWIVEVCGIMLSEVVVELLRDVDCF